MREKRHPLGPELWVPVGRVLQVMITMPEYRKLKEKMEREQNVKKTHSHSRNKVAR